MTTTFWIVLIAVLLAAAVAVALTASRQAHSRRLWLRRRFGPEYERAVARYGGPARAEKELALRAKRVARFRLRPLEPADRARFAASWTAIQARFVDDPARAVREANELIKDVIAALGYPSNDFEGRSADLSVDHPEVIEDYRAAHALAEANLQGRANTEELRQAVVHYRALFAELVDGAHAAPARELREVTA